MTKSKTNFQQIPVKEVKKIAQEQEAVPAKKRPEYVGVTVDPPARKLRPLA
jgi:hypothetical protein